MRRALLVASLLILSGCAAEPAETASPSAQVSQQTEENSSMDVEAESAEPDQEASEEAEFVDSEGTEDADEELNDEDETERESEAESESQDEPRETQDTEPTENPEPSQEPTQEPEPSPTAEETFQGYTLSEVSQRDSAAECWVAIDGGVYDLTQWIPLHRGGSGAILNLCGKDGTASFTSQHGGQSRPSSTLDGYYLAPLIG